MHYIKGTLEGVEAEVEAPAAEIEEDKQLGFEKTK